MQLTRRTFLATGVALATGCRARGRSAAAGRASILDFIPTRYHAAIRQGTFEDDLTQSFRTAFLHRNILEVPAGHYRVTSVSIPPGAELVTGGFGTTFHQLPTATDVEPILLVEGANVSIGDCTLIGLIRGFRAGGSEFNHGILIAGRAAGDAVSNVQIGNIRGIDLRGDAVSVYCERGGQLDGVRIGNVHGENVLRNVVAIVGGRNISVGDISATSCGYYAFDIEPEGSYSTPVEGVRVRSVRGPASAIQADPSSYVRDVRIERLETSPRFTAMSSPPFVNRNGVPYDRDVDGLVLRNAYDIHIGEHRAEGHRNHAVRTISDRSRSLSEARSLTLGKIAYGGIGVSERTYRTLINAMALEELTIQQGAAELVGDDQVLVLGNNEYPETRCHIADVTTNGMVAKNVAHSNFERLRINASSSRRAFQGLRDCQMTDSTVIAGSLGYDLDGLDVENSVIDQPEDAMRTAIASGPRSRLRLQAATVNGRRLNGAYTAEELAQSTADVR